MLTQERLKELVRYDPETGTFTRLVNKKRARAGALCGSLSTHSNPYVECRIDGKLYRQHQLAFLYMTGEWAETVDHIDGCSRNNRWVNLRAVPQSAQNLNAKRNRANRSGLMGVFWDRGAYMTYIDIANKRHYLGRQTDFFEACCVRKAAELRYGFHPNHGRS